MPWSSGLSRGRLKQPWFAALTGLKGAVTAWRDENPSEAVGFKLVFLGLSVLSDTKQGLYVHIETGGLCSKREFSSNC